MPALPPVPGVLKSQLQWDVGLDDHVTTTNYWAYSGSQPNGTACSNFATVLANLVGAQNGLWSGSTILVGCEMTDLTSNSAAVGSATSDFPGADNNPQIGASSCLLINYRISRRYRGGKPRNYFPWGDTAKLASRQQWLAAFVAECASGWSSIASGFIGQAEGGATISNHCSVSYYAGSKVVISPTTGRSRNVPILRSNPQVDTITSFAVSAVLGSQRRRNRA